MFTKLRNIHTYTMYRHIHIDISAKVVILELVNNAIKTEELSKIKFSMLFEVIGM